MQNLPIDPNCNLSIFYKKRIQEIKNYFFILNFITPIEGVLKEMIYFLYIENIYPNKKK